MENSKSEAREKSLTYKINSNGPKLNGALWNTMGNCFCFRFRITILHILSSICKIAFKPVKKFSPDAVGIYFFSVVFYGNSHQKPSWGQSLIQPLFSLDLRSLLPFLLDI